MSEKGWTIIKLRRHSDVWHHIRYNTVKLIGALLNGFTSLPVPLIVSYYNATEPLHSDASDTFTQDGFGCTFRDFAFCELWSSFQDIRTASCFFHNTAFSFGGSSQFYEAFSVYL